MAVLVPFLVLLLFGTGTSQSNNHVNNTNIPIHTFCGHNALINLQHFNMNRKSTFDDLRMQLLTNNYNARARNLGGEDSIYATAQCRNYLSVDQCVACFDAGVSVLVNCRDGNGAFVLLDNCFIRYEDFVDFYNDPDVTQDGTGTPFSSCDNQSSSQPISTLNQVVDGLLSDIRDATPKTPNLYVASKRQIANENETVYVIAQCAGNGNKTNCRACMDAAYNKLNDCLPNTEGRFFDMGCFARYSVTPLFNDNQTIDITNILKGHSSKAAILGGVIGVVLFLLILLLWFLYWQRKKSKKAEQDASDLKGAVNYNYKDLQLATNNFSEENILGKGGFGEVYKAVLDDKNVVAVKRLHVQDDRAKEEFENEVKLISNVHHRNLLRLLGWSSEGSDLLLVLEYMPNGSLDRFLWGAKRGTIDWNQRYEIIFGIARGLVHLHNEFHVKIIHRDIKCTNILLSEDYKPKIADFGLARFQPEDQSHVITNFAGTLGYTAPEYVLHGLLSDKVDTYSFGVVILEIISGRRSTDVKSDQPSTADYLLEHAWKLYEKKLPLNFIDETLDLNQHEKKQVTKIIEIALLCTQSPVSERPTMSEVVLMLQDDQSWGKRQLTRPTFLNNEDRRVYISSSKKSVGSSINVYNQRN